MYKSFIDTFKGCVTCNKWGNFGVRIGICDAYPKTKEPMTAEGDGKSCEFWKKIPILNFRNRLNK